ncbi:MAG: DUF2924 domain-containing protein [Planctomycetes bacterium]|nr:DUF2924 domain-containing protein [Planctomycetota bacterium]
MIRPATPAANALTQIAELQTLDVGDLLQRWHILVGGNPPRGRQALLGRLIHRVQEIAHGGLSREARERLEAIADADEKKGGDAKVEAPITGTVYRREWRGELHEVVAEAEGFAYRGRRYRSLTAVAKAVTGQHWNGKLFFGLTPRKGGRK